MKHSSRITLSSVLIIAIPFTAFVVSAVSSPHHEVHIDNSQLKIEVAPSRQQLTSAVEQLTQTLEQQTEAYMQANKEWFERYHAQQVGSAGIERNKVTVPQNFQVLYTDIYIAPLKMLIEIKGITTRESIRVALGQLLDYERFIDVNSMAILVPSKVPCDLVELLSNHNIKVIYKDDGKFKLGDGTQFTIS